MAEAGAWRVLGEGSRPGVVLAVDYPFTGRPEAGFADLVTKLDTAYAVWETVPPTGAAAAGMTGAGYVGRWLDGIGAENGPGEVRAVLGYCAGSVYAAELASRLAARQPQPPRLVLFDPEAPDAVTVYWQFHKVIDGLAVVLPAEEVAAAQRAGERASKEIDDLRLLGDALFEIFKDAGAAAFAKAGLNEARREEFAGTVGSFLSYLIAAAQLDPRTGWATATAISSRTPTNGLNLVTAEERAALVGRDIRFELEHADLLRDNDVAAAVSGLLG